MRSTEKETAAVVLIGSFNPSIFQPSWFGAENVIRKQEAEGANIEIISPDVTVFSLEWMRLEVMRERFAATSLQPGHEQEIRDLVQSTFGLLRHTHVRLMGINYEGHVKVQNEEEWHAAGDKLAPKAIWERILPKPGMRSLVIQSPHRGEAKGYVQIKVEPSAVVRPGIYVAINNHFELEGAPELSTGSEVVRMLKQSWDGAIGFSREIIASLSESL